MVIVVRCAVGAHAVIVVSAVIHDFYSVIRIAVFVAALTIESDVRIAGFAVDIITKVVGIVLMDTITTVFAVVVVLLGIGAHAAQVVRAVSRFIEISALRTLELVALDGLVEIHFSLRGADHRSVVQVDRESRVVIRSFVAKFCPRQLLQCTHKDAVGQIAPFAPAVLVDEVCRDRILEPHDHPAAGISTIFRFNRDDPGAR
jgi:hypothetical protein